MTEQNETLPDTSDEASDQDLIDASREAGGTESVDVDREAAEAAARVEEAANPKPTTAPAETPAGEPAEPKIAAILRAREKAFKEQEDAKDYAAQMRARAEQEAAQMRAQARKQAEDDYRAEIEARRAKFAESPTQALRELGHPSEAIVDAVAREGSPEWRAMRQLQQELAETRAKVGSVDSVKADFEAFKQSVKQERFQEQRQESERVFLSQLASPEKAPYLHKRYDPEEILDRAHKKAAEWREAGIQFANADVAEYLEHQARQRLAGVSSPPPQVSGGSGAPKVRANGSRTLSAAGGSERRASPRSLADMAPDEERDALIEAAREARRTLKADT